MNKKIIAGIVVVIIGALGFYGGVKYESARSSDSFANMGQRFGQLEGNTNMQARGGASAGLVVGDVLSKDEQSLTLKLRDGGSRIVMLSSETSIEKFASGSLSDLVVGKAITVQGSQNSDGSLTARSIQLRSIVVAAPPTDR